jgi:YcaO-like protein with predicted kinase domain
MSVRLFGREYAQPKRYIVGTHRSRPPAETLADYERFMGPLGITRLANVTGLDCIGLPVYMAIRPNARGLSTAQGKGIDTATAKASALMESIENWHGERIDKPLRYESYLALRREAAVVDVTRLPTRAGLTLRLDVPMLWIEGYDLLQQRSTWVPYSLVSVNFVRDPNVVDVFSQNSNGLASGNHLLEAVVHGLCEVIERDASALASLAPSGPRVPPRLDLATVDDEPCARVLAMIDRAGVRMVARDITSDINIPAYDCVIFDRHDLPRWSMKGFCSGQGCHLSPAVALMRAVTEAVQSRLTLIAGSRDDNFTSAYEAFVDPVLLKKEAARIDAPAPGRAFRRSSLATDTLEGDLGVLLEAVRGAGLDSVVVVDLTRPEIGVPVVRVIVPGLEAYHKGLDYSSGARARARIRGEA